MARFIFFVRITEGQMEKIQEWSFEADSTKHAVKLLKENAPEETEIRACYKEIKSWNKYDIKII